MISYILRRMLLWIPTLVLISIITFILIQLPPGSFFEAHIANMMESGEGMDPAIAEAMMQELKRRYALDQPLFIQYFKWITDFVQGDFGMSFEWNRPVKELIGNRLQLTVILSLSTMVFVWVVALPIGIYSATHQYSFFDYTFTFLGFLGLATPNFLFALVLLFIGYKYYNSTIGGLFSPEFMDEGWSFAKVVDLIKHIWVPIVVIGTAGTAGSIRVMRGNLLDELQKQYVITARAKGVHERKLLFKYPVRVALNPFASTIGWSLARIISGATITAVVLNLPTVGPLMLSALTSQDMYLAGTFLFFQSILTVIGTLISDILLSILDPRIRFGRK